MFIPKPPWLSVCTHPESRIRAKIVEGKNRKPDLPVHADRFRIIALFVWCVSSAMIIQSGAAASAGEALDSGGGREEAVRYTSRVRDVPVLRGVMSPDRNSRVGDLETLADWKVTLVRYQITRNWGMRDTDRDLDDYDRWLEGKLANLEEMLEPGRRLGIRFVIDLHTPPGGRVENSVMVMFDDEKYADHFVEVWKRIARRFKDHPDKEAIWGYDLMNEPVLSSRATELHAADALFLRAARAIREIDPDSVIFIPSFVWGGPGSFANLKPLPLENVVYQAHMYEPLLYTHQFVLPETTPPIPGSNAFLKYPGLINGEFWDKERLRKELQPVRDFQLKHGARIYIGEFSAVSWAPNAEGYLRDCIEIFEEYGWDWSYHSFREWEGFSLDHEGQPSGRFWPAKNNPRKRVMLAAWEKNERDLPHSPQEQPAAGKP